MNTIAKRFFLFVFVCALAFATFPLAACGSKASTDASQTEASLSAEASQDNCYGDDLPAINGD